MDNLRSALPAIAGWAGIIAIGVAIALLVLAVGIWGRPVSVSERRNRHRRWVRKDEPLLPQLWRFLQVMAAGRAVTSVVGGFKALEVGHVEQLLADARYPLGLKRPSDVYAVGMTMGVILGLAGVLLSGLSIFGLMLAPSLVLGGMMLPVLGLKAVIMSLKQAMVRELWTLLSALELYIAAGYTLEEALREASGCVVLLREPLQGALLKWGAIGAGPALDELGRELRLPEAFLVLGAIRKATEQDPQLLGPFLVREGIRLEKTLEANQARSAQIKPLIQNVCMFVPMFNFFTLFTAPWAYTVFEQLQNGI